MKSLLTGLACFAFVGLCFFYYHGGHMFADRPALPLRVLPPAITENIGDQTFSCLVIHGRAGSCTLVLADRKLSAPAP